MNVMFLLKWNVIDALNIAAAHMKKIYSNLY